MPINGDNIPPLWSVPTPSKNTQQIVLFLSHCGSYTGENHSRKICLRRISAWLCPLECHGMEGIEAAVDTKSLGNVKKVFAKSCGNPDFRSIFGHQRAKNEGTNTTINRGPETYPISINPRDEINWANSFREKLRKPCLQTDGRTDGWTDGRTDRHQGESSIPPFHLRWSGGIIKGCI